jgi:hypothetical protein
LGTSVALAQDAGKTAKIEEMLRLTKTDEMMQQVMSQMKAMNLQQLQKNLAPDEKAQAAEMQQKIFDLVNAKMSWEKFKPAIVQIYAEVYTDEELDGILAFYRSPAGHAMIEKMPQLMSRTMAVAQKLMGDIQPEIEKMVKESAPKDKK